MNCNVIKTTVAKFHTTDILVIQLNQLLRDRGYGIEYIECHDSGGGEIDMKNLKGDDVVMRLHIHYWHETSLNALCAILVHHLCQGESIAFTYKGYRATEPEVFRLYKVNNVEWRITIDSLCDFLDEVMTNEKLKKEIHYVINAGYFNL